MMTEAEILSAVQAELGANLNPLLPTAQVTRWFNEGQARLQWYTHGVEAVTWLEGDLTVTFASAHVGVDEILYPEDAQERRWRPIQGGLIIEDYDGAAYDGDAKVIVRTYWPEVSSGTPSSLPREGDAACIAYVLHRFYRFLVADRSVYQRYSTMMGENGVGINDLSNTSDDHYKDFLDLRADLPVEPGSAFFPEG